MNFLCVSLLELQKSTRGIFFARFRVLEEKVLRKKNALKKTSGGEADTKFSKGAEKILKGGRVKTSKGAAKN